MMPKTKLIISSHKQTNKQTKLAPEALSLVQGRENLFEPNWNNLVNKRRSLLIMVQELQVSPKGLEHMFILVRASPLTSKPDS